MSLSIRSDNYIQISGWMVTELELKGNELIIYALIHGFSQDGKSVFSGGLNYVREWTHLTKRTCMDMIKSLLDKHLIIRRERKDAVPYQDPPYEYYTVRSRPNETLSETNISPQKNSSIEENQKGPTINTPSEKKMEISQEDSTKVRLNILSGYIGKLFNGQVDTSERVCGNLDKELSMAGVSADEYTNYIGWAYGYLLEKCRDPKTLPGYFYRSISRPDLIKKFLNFQIEKKDEEMKALKAEISCLICGTIHNRNHRCPTCNNFSYELSILSDEQIHKIKQYYFLSPENKSQYCKKLSDIQNKYPSSIILRNKELKKEMDLDIYELDLEFGLISYMEKKNDTISEIYS